ncbi:nicotinate-nucleotide adenylyltransferase [Kiloniella sp. b19]|uniref:nicotinate-nucleotide adenylyltransferase n=1 Tax=Kiloniella sp. GXU_MW_B19 TaxID=3141326 RepID=UPI0031E21B20
MRQNRPFATPHTLARELGAHLPSPGQRIGLLGGSFNPAHEAHLDISLQAMKSLGLDEVWWLVSPQNPLKSEDGMAPQDIRHLQADVFAAGHRRIRVTRLESLLGTRYTRHSLDALQKHFPKAQFVWLMGSDNLAQITKWHGWQEIFTKTSIAVFSRPSYSLRASASKAAQRYRRHRLPERRARKLSGYKAPVWTLIHGKLSSQSSTKLRETAPDWADKVALHRAPPS